MAGRKKPAAQHAPEVTSAPAKNVPAPKKPTVKQKKPTSVLGSLPEPLSGSTPANSGTELKKKDGGKTAGPDIE